MATLWYKIIKVCRERTVSLCTLHQFIQLLDTKIIRQYETPQTQWNYSGFKSLISG